MMVITYISLRIAFVWLLFSVTLPRWSGWAWEVCSAERGGGACPNGNTCCAIPQHQQQQRRSDDKKKGKKRSSASFVSGCIPNDLGSYNGTCCHDDPTTGCAVGYLCGPEQQCFFVGTTSNNNNEPIDPYVQVLPRYHLCQEHTNPSSSSSFRHVRGFPVVLPHPSNETVHLWYYSSHGDLTALSEKKRQQIQRALIFIHGAARNADDYFCVATKAAQLYQHQQQQQQQHGPTNRGDILVLAPRFVTPTDQPFDKDAANIPNLLQWMDDGSGPWRYGANAILPPVAATNNISSYTAMDQVVSFLGDAKVFPNLRHLAIAGHSSGGQFVQRYALLTAGSSAWSSKSHSSISSSNKKERVMAAKHKISRTSIHSDDGEISLHVRFVVANPSSYAYLTPLRFVEEQGAWVLPKPEKTTTTTFTSNHTSCVPQYNQYPWGLQPSDVDDNANNNDTLAIVVPYKERALEALNNNVTALIQRFLQQRQVVYLIGSVDRCNLSSAKLDNRTTNETTVPAIGAGKPQSALTANDNPAWHSGGEWWCDSHGLETSCMDLWQGSNRWFRHVHYMNSLKLVQQQYLPKSVSKQPSPLPPPPLTHTSNVVEGVGHDHSLIYLSTAGLEALWGDGV